MTRGRIRTAESRTPRPQRPGVAHGRLEHDVADPDVHEAGRPRTAPAAPRRSGSWSGPGGKPGGGGASAAAAASTISPSSRFRLGASQDESASHPPGRRTLRASASATSGRPDVVEHEVADDRVERPLARRDRLERADAERDRRVGERRPADHRGRHVDAHRVRAERRRGRRQLPRPAAHVQHLPAGRDLGEGEDRAAHPPGHRATGSRTSPRAPPSRRPRTG